MPFKHSGLWTSFLLPLSEALSVLGLQTAVKQCQSSALSASHRESSYYGKTTRKVDRKQERLPFARKEQNNEAIYFMWWMESCKYMMWSCCRRTCRSCIFSWEGLGFITVMLRLLHHEQKPAEWRENDQLDVTTYGTKKYLRNYLWTKWGTNWELNDNQSIAEFTNSSWGLKKIYIVKEPNS